MTPRNIPSVGWLRNLNTRQRKKMRVGEFQELGVQFQVSFVAPLDEAAHDQLIDDFVVMTEARDLLAASSGGIAPLATMEAYVIRQGRGSVTPDDVAAVLAWLQARAEVSTVKAEEPADAWYGFFN
jgi:uncharacterized protein